MCFENGRVKDLPNIQRTQTAAKTKRQKHTNKHNRATLDNPAKPPTEQQATQTTQTDPRQNTTANKHPRSTHATSKNPDNIQQ